jgi:pimeloyl-ACP methyl ester carboxylesterase
VEEVQQGGGGSIPHHVRPSLATASAVLATFALLAAACGRSTDTSAAPASPPATVGSSAAPTNSAAPSPTTPPLSPFTGDPFFDAGDAAPGAPGTVIRSREISTRLDDAQVWQVLYWSRTPEDRPVAVSATVVAPKSDADEPRPVFAFAHGTTGLGDQCAPSAKIADGSAAELAFFPVALQQGWVVVETDYQGLGTPGDHPYLIGQSEGRNVLDSIKAAEVLPGTGASPASKAIVWGHSQGGGAAAFTAELQPTYAPDVDLVGAIAGAPVAELDTAGAGTTLPQYSGFVPMAAAGLRAGYPDLDTNHALTAAGRQAVAQVASMCVSEALNAFAGSDASKLFAPGASERQDWKDDVEANRAGDRPTGVPIFLYHGADDDLIPPAASARLLERYCAHDVVATRTVYPGTNHVTVVTAAIGDILAYARARLAGTPAVSDCT